MTAETAGRPVVVTTAHRGVFFGFLDPAADQAAKVIELAGAQMCVYWSEDVQGVLGLASHGPSGRCKVTRPVSRVTLQDVTAVMDVTGEAVKLWQDRPWS